MNESIADAVEEMRGALEWTDEANALGEVECNWSNDDTSGWLRMGPVSVEWLRDPYGDGLEDWVAVNVVVDGERFDADGYSHLDDAVKDAARTTMEWQHYRDGEIRDAVAEWLDGRYEAYNLDGPQDDEGGDSWTITWGDVMVRGYYDKDGAFVWSVVNPESGDYLDGDASDDATAVINAMNECAKDPMVEVWIETITECVAEDDWTARVSNDGLTVQKQDPTGAVSRLATYGQVRFGEGRIGLLWRPLKAQWVPYNEHLPEDEADVRRMAREAYAWVKAVDA